MGKTRSKFITFIVVFSMLMSMGVSFAAPSSYISDENGVFIATGSSTNKNTSVSLAWGYDDDLYLAVASTHDLEETAYMQIDSTTAPAIVYPVGTDIKINNNYYNSEEYREKTTGKSSMWSVYVFRNQDIESAYEDNVSIFGIGGGHDVLGISVVISMPYRVLYDSNGGIGTQTDTKSYKKGVEVIVLDEGTISRDGYTFVEWNEESDGSGKQYDPGDTFNMPEEDVKLYAQWSAENQTLVYDRNTGSGTMTNRTEPTDKVFDLDSNEFTKEGYSFTGWNTAADGSGTVYADEASFTMPAGGYTLYAQWSTGDQTLVYDNNTGSGTMTNRTESTDKVFDLDLNEFTKEGYSFTGWNTAADGSGTAYADEASFTMPAGGDTIYAQWSVKEYTLTYEITGDYFTDSKYGEETYEFEEAVTAISTPSRTGYSFTGWEDVPGTMPANDVTVTGYFTADGDTPYTVEHHLEDLGADTYTLEDTDNLTGTTGLDTAAEANSYEGFTVKEFSQEKIAANGSTVVEIFYDRSEYTLTYEITGDYFTDSEYYTETYEFEEAVTAISTPSETGYSFTGWTGVPATMPANDVTVSGFFKANGDIPYTVEHHLEDLGADTYTLEDTDNLTGTTGLDTAAEANSYEGFTVQEFSQEKIAANGSTVVEIFYDRNEHTLTYEITGDYFTDSEYDTETYEFEEAVTAISTPSRTGYSFTGWAGVPATMPANDVTVSGFFKANGDIPYTVEHHLEDLGADTYTLEDTDNLTGTTGLDTAAEANSYEGFTVQEFSQEKIAANGSTVVEIFYDRNEYTLTYAIVGDYFTDAEYDTENYEFGAEVTAISTPSETGYSFTGWTGVPETMPARDVEVTGYFTREENPDPGPTPSSTTYTVTFEDFDGTFIKRDRVNPGRNANPPGDPTRTGFEFKGWEGNWRNVRKNEIVTATYDEIIEIDEPITEAPPVITPPVVAPPEVVEVPVEVPAAAPAPTLPKAGSVGAGEMAGFGALLMAIGILLGKKKGF